MIELTCYIQVSYCETVFNAEGPPNRDRLLGIRSIQERMNKAINGFRKKFKLKSKLANFSLKKIDYFLYRDLDKKKDWHII